MLVLTAIAAPLLLLHLSSTGMDTTYDYGLVRCLFGFALGIACHRIHQHWTFQPQPPGSRTGVMTTAECLMVAAVVGYVASAGTSAWSFLAPFVFAAAVLVFAVEGGLVSRLFRLPIFSWLGRLSYSIYLTHFLFVLTLPAAIKRVVGHDPWTAMPLQNGQYVMAFGRDDIEGTLYYAWLLAVTLAFSAFTFRWVETPGRDWTRRWLGRPEGAYRARSAPLRQQP
jgi:peptidoglycan/LPS O-acetylase OafA/YrhL